MAESVAAFWDLFRKRASELAAARSADSSVYDELLEQLHKANHGLYLEFSIDESGNELIVTADGNVTFFRDARSVVSQAPTVAGWTIRALKPRIGFPETVRWENQVIRVSTVVFDPLERDGSTDLGLRILVPGLDPAETDDAHNAILRAIDHGLGEESHAKSVQYTEVQPLGKAEDPGDFIPLSELEKYIKWRDTKTEGAV